MSILFEILNSINRALPKNPLLLTVISKAISTVAGVLVHAVRRLFILLVQQKRLTISQRGEGIFGSLGYYFHSDYSPAYQLTKRKYGI